MDDRPRRPPSYSDSLFFLPDRPLPPLRHSLQEPLLSPKTDIDEFTLTIQPSRTFTVAETWYNRLIGFAFHITLISLFETVFFFQFISKSEDTGLQRTVEGYINGILNSCNGWSPNTTQVVEDLLLLLINTTQVSQANNQALTSRQHSNNALQIQAWLYVAVLSGSLIIVVLLGQQASLRLAWKRILIENAIMVTLLGLYEFAFFKTIIYNYQNMSLPELNEFIVTQLQQTCGLLSI
jgi:hypothetical protein